MSAERLIAEGRFAEAAQAVRESTRRCGTAAEALAGIESARRAALAARAHLAADLAKLRRRKLVRSY